MNSKTTIEKDLEEKLAYLLEKFRNNLRQGQKALVDWKGGEMAVSAVPGAGKSHSLAVASACIIARNKLKNQKQIVKQVLIVTYTRSAAASIKRKIKEKLKELCLPQTGFIVQTIHGLALNIANRHPELLEFNLNNTNLIIPTPSHRIIRDCVEEWINQNNPLYQILLEGKSFDGEDTERFHRQLVLRTEILPKLAHTAIREAKSSGFSPQKVEELAKETNDEYQILTVAGGLYSKYQQLMRHRNLIDYDDMILAALKVLDNQKIRSFWQNQIFAVFEDEAQDSSLLQQKLIRILATNSKKRNSLPNLIRVGDPNQAINSTFTPADPFYFRQFCKKCKAESKLETMKLAGRSSQIIINTANFMIKWVNEFWQKEYTELEKPFIIQDILPVDSDDPQPNANPKPVGEGLEIHTPEDIYHTVKLIGEKIINLYQENSERNIAILVRENKQGSFLAQELIYLQDNYNIKIYEANENETNSRIPEEILKLLQFIDRPHSPDHLKEALEVLQQRQLITLEDLNSLITQPENFLYPSPMELPHKDEIQKASRLCCQLLRARLELPHYQLIQFIGMSLQYSGHELATVQKLGERIERQITNNSSVKTTITTLRELVNSEKFEGVEEEEIDESTKNNNDKAKKEDTKYTKNGQITIITMHKAKGLEWDYVFIPFLHSDVLPGEPWVPIGSQFLGDFTLADVARAHIRKAVHQEFIPDISSAKKFTTEILSPQEAWNEAGILQKAEEFRLLYVAMTRAKRLLWLSAAQNGPFRWSLFKRDEGINFQAKNPCPILPVLQKKFPKSVIN